MYYIVLTHKNQLHFYVNDSLSKKETKNIILFPKESKRIKKISGMILTKKVENMSNENHKTL